MTLVLQIILGLALLAGLIAPFVGNKYWHWSHLVLVLSIALAAVGFLFLAAETVRVHHVLRSKLPKLEKNLESLLKQNERLLNGSGNEQGLLEIEHQLQMLSRQRGRVWRGVMPAGEVTDQGSVSIEISQPQPHGLEQNAVVYAFEAGEVNPADPAVGRQYLGEFRVAEISEAGATLEPVLIIDQRTGQRLVESQGPWSLYETMPADSHKLYAGLDEEQLRQLLPESTVDEFIRHGTPATPDDDEWHKIGLDENDQLVGPENLDQAVKFLYNRPLRDYAYLFSELAQQRVVLQARRQAVEQDIVKIEIALKSAKQLGVFRDQQKTAFSADLVGMKGDRQAIEGLRDLVLGQLDKARQLIDKLLARNSQQAAQLTKHQMALLEHINRTAPAPGSVSLLAP